MSMNENIEGLIAFAREHGLAALFDHLGLDELGNEVELLRVDRDRFRAALEQIYNDAQESPMEDMLCAGQIARTALQVRTGVEH